MESNALKDTSMTTIFRANGAGTTQKPSTVRFTDRPTVEFPRVMVKVNQHRTKLPSQDQ